MESLIKKLDISRLELLDMGLRGNTLLHFKAGAKNIEMVKAQSSDVFKVLVTEQAAMSFIPMTEYKVNLVKASDTVLVDANTSIPETNTHLHTSLDAESLDKKLLTISAESESYNQEKGVDILYIALGFLTWFEDRHSETPRYAPLILLPASLERENAKQRFHLRYTQADLGSNLTLAAKLKTEFQLTLPEFDEEFEVETYLDTVIESIKNEPRWQVSKNEIALGFFSFGKFQMYQDLSPDNWSENNKPYHHPIFQKLLGAGFHEDNEGQLEPSQIPLPELTELHLVKDADSSQTAAIVAVKQGHHLIIQGPPGTGKSQTITNIISESLADGKTVLFVAEKIAALDVVKRRLDECHLGDAVLELHSHKSHKKAVLDELQRTLSLGKPTVQDRTHEKNHYLKLRQQLDAYCHQVNHPILSSKHSYIQALGLSLSLDKETYPHTLPLLDFTPLRHWDHTQFIAACGLVQEMVTQLEIMGEPANNTFAHSTLESFSPVEQKHITQELLKAQTILQECRESGHLISEEMSLPAPQTLSELEITERTERYAAGTPNLTGISLRSNDWQSQHHAIKELIEATSAIHSLELKHKNQLIDQAWQADLLSTRQAWATAGKHWWRFISSDFRQAKRTLQGLLKGELPPSADAAITLIDDILMHQTLTRQSLAHEALGQRLFGTQWQGKHSDWASLNTLSTWMFNLHTQIAGKQLSEHLLDFLERGSIFKHDEKHLNFSTKIEAFTSIMQSLSTRLACPLPHTDTQALEEQPLTSLAQHLSDWHDHIDSMNAMIRYNGLRKKLCANELAQIDRLSYEWSLPPSLLLTSLKQAWYKGLINEAYQENEALKHFDRTHHENTIQEFKRIDEKLAHFAQEALILKHHQQLPPISSAGEMGILLREINKKRRHLSIRQLIIQAGRAIQQIKPIVMMSPMSVATYLAQGALNFDLVIFDEASQIKVVDALGAILRGKQVVVVGDTKQMPPTDFFSKALELSDEDAEESQTADIESILSLFLAKGAPQSMLRWHYRSRHDSLITVSNQEFYEGRLMIFPSPGINPYAKGLVFHHYPDSVYERGTSRTNPIEARRVAEAVMRHAQTHPNLSLGVVAFSTVQRDCILLEVERLRRATPSSEAFFSSHKPDAFFIKNLENVQGDERDVIFISIGYGRISTGNMSMSFGAINREGGERRLNVLITRSRLAMEVFCNFTADDMATQSDSPLGVRALKNFLRYAQTGVLENRHETGKEIDSPFEAEIISAIRHLNYELEPQLGSAGFYIDIAVKDPQKRGRYILAVECDGASYHSSVTARDRDRLRQTVLENLGWRFHRIWSTDWFRNPAKEIERLKEAIEQAIYFYQALAANTEFELSAQALPAPEVKKIERDAFAQKEHLKADVYIIASELDIPNGTEIYELSLERVGQALQHILQVEGCIHIKEAARRLANSAGFTRVGTRMLGHIEQAARYSQLYIEQEFLFLDSSKPIIVRDRSDLPATAKKIELVSREEIREALIMTIRAAFSLSCEEAISETLSLIGFQRSTAKAKQPVEALLDELIQEGIISMENDKVSIV